VTVSQRPAAPGIASKLEEERDFLLVSLRDLERERAAGEISESDYSALYAEYTARTAAVLRAIRQDLQESPEMEGKRAGVAAPAGSVPSGATAGSGRSGGGRAPWNRRRTMVTAASVFLLVVLASVTLANVAGSRRSDQAATGSVAVSPSGRVEQALRLERDGRATDALKLYDAVIGDEPTNVAALSYRGWLLKRAGLADEALASLDKAIAADPSYPDAHFFRGMVLYQDRNDPAGAVPEFRLFLSNRPPPEMVPMVQGVLEEAAKDADQGPTGPSERSTPTVGGPSGTTTSSVRSGPDQG